ncbi:MAG: bifunctional transaldolase/phosoglucose isomerase [Bradyrhizobiaceae bacterium]|nr:MAG: bifunctional transaldolase/phosoglucose isomerase [Bradyrhizobiaceae bacterium]
MNHLKELEKHGQSIWLDFLARGFIARGELKTLVERDGVRGVTSNPSIFEKAIGSGDEYDGAISRLLKERDRPVIDLYEAVAVEDIQHAADVLRPVYDHLKGADGFVSLEVSPYLALDTEGTLNEARRLWKAVNRDNLMVKVPATREGLPAIEQLISEGISINITLLFSQQVYAQVLEAYLVGLEKFVAGGGDPKKIASVASFFVSRIDVEADKQLDEKIAAANDRDQKARLEALKGKTAIANAKLAYQHYKKVIATDRWKRLEAAGARVQRLLWASTGTKNKAYSDVLYVEELIGKDTVNTVPPATLDAFRDHGKTRDSLEENVPEAEKVLADLARTGISLDTITKNLVDEGVKLFADAADKLLGAVAAKRTKILGAAIDSQKLALGTDLDKNVKTLVQDWAAQGKARRLWKHDSSVWTGHDENKWLGWLDAVEREQKGLSSYQSFADWVKREDFSDAVVLGMGGSSLGPEVLAVTFNHGPGFPRLQILDSTDPAQISRVEASIKPDKTLFIVSSKSGSTTEPNVLMDYFFTLVTGKLKDKAGSHFVAVTDPGSVLEKTAKSRGFAHIFFGEPSIGGRYSVLSPFGLVPAAAAGIDLGKFLDLTASMVRACGADVPPSDNPGIQLGLALGAANKAGRDKVTLSASEKIADFGAWAEQLIAESTGKNGNALIPLAGEALGKPEVYGRDRIFVDLHLTDDKDEARQSALAALEKDGHPVVRIEVTGPQHIGQEFFRFEIATAVAGSVMGINPFDQPDVEAAKIKTRELTAAFEKSGALPKETPVMTDGDISVFTDEKNVEALRKAGADGTAVSWLKAHLSRIKPGDYTALLAYIDRNEKDTDAVQSARMAIRDKKHVATCVGFGPRFLHSTGQAYKGGPNTGVFIQITADDAKDLPVPDQKASFGIIKAAQARGDFDVLTERGRRALRLHIKGDVAKGLATINSAIGKALT